VPARADKDGFGSHHTGNVSASFLLLAAATGALSLLTPCVFPMIPITIAYFNSRDDRKDPHVVRHALLFGAGIVLTFTALGLGLAIIVGASGITTFAANPWVNIAIGVVFIAFALSLFGVYNLPLPFSNRFVNRVDASARGQSGRAAGSVLMGAAFTLASFTCTAPFVGPLLVSAARGEWQQPLAGMAVFSVVFASPFILLALVPKWTSSIPRGGAWFRDVKVVVGLFEIAAALKFFSNADLVWGTGLISREVMLMSWLAITLAAAAWLLYSAIRRRGNPNPLRWIPTLAAAGAALWLGTGLQGRSLGELEAFVPPGRFTDGDQAAHLAWITNDHDAALATARATNRLVFVDFTGYTCTNCRWMEANMFTRPEVKASLSGFVLSRLFTDGEGEIYQRQQQFQEQRFGTIALPLYAIVDGNGRTVETFSGLTRNSRQFLAFLRKASQRNRIAAAGD
jgi:thiol:disulfide interchange protein